MGNFISRKRNDPKDYEKVLGELDDQVRALDVSIIESRSNERRLAILIMIYGALGYLIIILYIFVYPWRSIPTIDWIPQPFFDGMLLCGYPFLLWSFRRAAQWLYRRQIGSLEAKLKKARTEQKIKLEELKKQTAYYQTKGLLERFDPEFGGKSKKGETGVNKKEIVKEDPNIPAPAQLNRLMNQNAQIGVSNNNIPMPTPSPRPVHVTAPNWFDRLMDSLIGDDRMSKYALVCPRCHSHNGLVRPEEYDTIQYTCPNCKLFIPARKPTSPIQSPSTSPSQSPILLPSSESLPIGEGSLEPLESPELLPECSLEKEPVVDSADSKQEQEPIAVESSPKTSRRRTKKK